MLFFAGEDCSTEGGNGHEGHGRGDDIIGAGGGVLLGLGLGGVLGAVGVEPPGTTLFSTLVLTISLKR